MDKLFATLRWMARKQHPIAATFFDVTWTKVVDGAEHKGGHGFYPIPRQACHLLLLGSASHPSTGYKVEYVIGDNSATTDNPVTI